jgi:hypothetical protein
VAAIGETAKQIRNLIVDGALSKILQKAIDVF